MPLEKTMKKETENKLKLLSLLIMLLVFTGCVKEFDEGLRVYHFFGTAAFVLGMLLFPFRHKITEFLKGEKRAIKIVLIFALMLFLGNEQIFAQDISFEPAISTFLKIVKSFARITAGTSGFYGLTRVGWLLVNEDRSAGTAFMLSIIGFFSCTLAVGLLP